jgi:GTP-dependent phosphoenolpyruvate carboxykinase
MDVDGLGDGGEKVAELPRVDLGGWLAETESIAEHLAKFADKLPRKSTEKLTTLRPRVEDGLAHRKHDAG